MKKTVLSICLAMMLIIGSVVKSYATPTVYTYDFIDDKTRTNFNGFEKVPEAEYGRFGPSWTEGGITVEQINGKSGAQVTYSFTEEYGFEGTRSWYPNGGDFGYTKITLDVGDAFNSVGFIRGSGGGETEPPFTNVLFYQLLTDGNIILEGSVANGRTNPNIGLPLLYLGFFGTGADSFNEIRVWEEVYYYGYPYANALAIDSIEVSRIVPPVFSCVGFKPPMDKPVSVKKNRVLPLRMELLDEHGVTIIDLDIDAPPIVDVDFDGAAPATEPEKTYLPAGQGDVGNQFVFSGSKWQFDLNTKNFGGSGTYMIKAISGDPGEYIIDPTCTATFVIE